MSGATSLQGNASPRPDRRQLLFGGALLALTGASLALKPRRILAPLATGTLGRLVPQTIGPWRYATTSGLVVPPEDELSKRLYDEVLTRIYVAPGGAQLALLIAYGSAQNSTLQLHRPENCYPSAGYTLRDPGTVQLALGRTLADASVVTAQSHGVDEQLLYWTRIDRSFTTDGRADRAAATRANLRGYLPDGVLVRLSIQSPDRTAALATLARFNSDLLSAMGGEGRRVLLGSAA